MEGLLQCTEEHDWDERSPSQASPAPYDTVESDVEDDGSDSGDEFDDNDESFAYSLAKEAEFLPLANYPAAFQPSGTVSRAAVVGWMLRASKLHRFGFSTTVLAVNLFDRFLSVYTVKANQGWLVTLAATAALSVAGKVEEVRMPSLIDIQACGDLRVDPRYVCKMELLLLQTLQWRVTNATAASFVCYLLRRLHLPVAERRRSIREHAFLVLRRVIEEPLFLQHRPSVLAAAALKVAVRQGEWEAVGAAGVKRLWDSLDEIVDNKAGDVERCLDEINALLPKWVAPHPESRSRRARASVRSRHDCQEDRNSPTSVLDFGGEDGGRSPCASSAGAALSEDECGSSKRQRVG